MRSVQQLSRFSTTRRETGKLLAMIFLKDVENITKIRDENLLNCCGRRDAKGPKDACNSERSRQELSNEDFVAKLVFDTALLFSCGIFDLINRLASPKTIPQFAKKVVRQLDRLR